MNRFEDRCKELEYLYHKPRKIIWKVVAGQDNLDWIQKYDLVYDAQDFKLRQLEYRPRNAI